MVLFQEIYLEDKDYLCLAYGYRYLRGEHTYDDNFDFGIVSKKDWVAFCAKEWPKREEVAIANRCDVLDTWFFKRKDDAIKHAKALAKRAEEQGGLTAFLESEKAFLAKGKALAKRFKVIAVDAHERPLPKRFTEFADYGYVIKCYRAEYDDGTDYEGSPSSYYADFYVLSNNGFEMGVDSIQADAMLKILRYERKHKED